jgi:hypothetical protein
MIFGRFVEPSVAAQAVPGAAASAVSDSRVRPQIPPSAAAAGK